MPDATPSSLRSAPPKTVDPTRRGIGEVSTRLGSDAGRAEASSAIDVALRVFAEGAAA